MQPITVIVPAAGVGRRLGLGKNKAFATVGGLPLLVLCLRMLAGTGLVRRAVVVTGAAEQEETRQLLDEYRARCFPDLETTVTAGGRERQDSVANGLSLVPDAEGYVAVHDGARPFAGTEVFTRTLALAERTGAAIAAVPVKDTVKVAGPDGFITATPDRATLWAAQTPQIFEVNLLRRAYALLADRRTGDPPLTVTDDASLVEALGHPVALAEGSYDNIKITTPEDLLLAEEIAKRSS
ncbi:MAG: 2-C-methyl-D-erythritol 4-phosphate cytidylyltransferase [Succiniclasticum sp.]|jgi:2-C-methyl-D-erythritol 4-phosphate cytidylyltransferase